MDGAIEPQGRVYGVSCMGLPTRAMQKYAMRRSARF